MFPSTRVLCGLPVVWICAVIARSAGSRLVADRNVGRTVSLVHTSSVYDTGDRLWRGPAPTIEGYEELARRGVTLIVDLRAENPPQESQPWIAANGLHLVWLPIQDGRAPDSSHVETLDLSRHAADGITYVHCRAGEGRTGSLVGAANVRHGTAKRNAMADALAIGSLTFSQLAFISSAGRLAPLITTLHWLVDWPTERCFDLARRTHET